MLEASAAGLCADMTQTLVSRVMNDGAERSFSLRSQKEQ